MLVGTCRDDQSDATKPENHADTRKLKAPKRVLTNNHWYPGYLLRPHRANTPSIFSWIALSYPKMDIFIYSTSERNATLFLERHWSKGRGISTLYNSWELPHLAWHLKCPKTCQRATSLLTNREERWQAETANWASVFGPRILKWINVSWYFEY